MKRNPPMAYRYPRTVTAVLFVLAALVIASTRCDAQTSTPGTTEQKHASIIWLNSFYGRNNSGVGVAARWWYIGVGTTFFRFAGDTAHPLSPRPGGIGFTLDFYLAADFNETFAIYGNVGYVGRAMTYNSQEKFLAGYKEPDPVSVGGGVQLTLVTHVVLGAGFNAILPTVDSDNNKHRQNPITSVVAQLGWRF
jgi:hypothetical protein